MNDIDLLDEQLKASFDTAHIDPRWAAPGWTDPVARVRRRAAVVRRRVAAVTVIAAVVAIAGVAAVVPHLRSADRISVQPAGGDVAATGLPWLLTPAQYAAYSAAHPSPSAAPDHVASPAPADAELQSLQADAVAALPAGARVVRADAADGGVRGDAVVWLRLADGTPVVVEREKLDYPRVLSTSTAPSSTDTAAPEHFTDPATWDDGTAYTVITGSLWGYGLDAQTHWQGPFVWTVTPDGWFTYWTAPVGAHRLLGWARAGDKTFTVGGGAG
jgi:hypothetical protein